MKGQLNSKSIDTNDKNSIGNLQEKEKLYVKDSSFTYLDKKHVNPILFPIEKTKKNTFGNRFKNKVLIFGILASNDNFNNNLLLKISLDSISNNLQVLSKFGIDTEKILVCVFFNQIITENIFPKYIIDNINNDKDYIFWHYQTNKELKNIFPVLLFAKKNYVNPIENIKFYYKNVLSELLNKDQFIFSSILINGVSILQNNLSEMILACYDEKEKNRIIIPAIETISSGLISLIQQYEFVHYNLYNLNYFDLASTVPINSFFNLMCMNQILLNSINNFYTTIYNDSSLFFHDYNLGLNLYSQGYIIFYNSSITVNITQNDISYNDFMYNYTKKYSGNYANFFQLIRTFIDFKRCNIIQKIFLCFQIIGSLFEFIFPSLAGMVIYSILFEAFEIKDGRTASFFTLLYYILMIISGSTYLNSDNHKKIKITSLILYIIVELYYLFLIICSVLAMHHLRKNKINDRYKFNTASLVFLLILNIIPPLIPIILGIGKIIPCISGMILYIFLGVPTTNTNFYMNYILNCSDSYGGYNKSDRKGILIFVFYLFNIFFSSLIFFLTTRSRRVGCVLTLTSILTVYNLIKMGGISFRILFVESKINEIIIEPNKVDKIKKEIENRNKLIRKRINNDSNDEFKEYILDDEKEIENENENEIESENENENNNKNNHSYVLKNKNNDSYDLRSVSQYSRAHTDIINRGNNNKGNNSNSMSPKKTALGYNRP